MRSRRQTRSAAEDPAVWRESERFWAVCWPEFMRHDAVAERCFAAATHRSPHLTLTVGDERGVAAVVNGVAIAWDGSVAGLPQGWDHALELALTVENPDAVVGLAVMVEPTRRREGWGEAALRALVVAARQAGLARLVIPVRPSGKAAHAHLPLSDWAGRRSGGEPADPWLRTHERMGGRVLGICERSMVIEGSSAQWTAWTGIPAPADGVQVVPDGLVPVRFAGGRGCYVEPNVWVEHAVPTTP